METEENRKWYAGELAKAEPLARKMLEPCHGLKSKDAEMGAILAAVIAAKQSDMPEDLFLFSLSQAYDMTKVII